MRASIDVEIERIIADSRAAVEASRRLIERCKREQKSLQELLEESRRTLAALRQGQAR